MRKPSVERYGDTIRKHGVFYKLEPEKKKGSCSGCAFEQQYCSKELTNICTSEHIIFERLTKKR